MKLRSFFRQTGASPERVRTQLEASSGRQGPVQREFGLSRRVANDKSGTSSLVHLYSKDTSFQGIENLIPEKNVLILIFVSVTSIQGTSPLRGKGYPLWFPYPRFNLSSGDTLALKKLTNQKKKVDTFMCTLVKMTTTFTTLTISFK